jgi:hypothetical protein
MKYRRIIKYKLLISLFRISYKHLQLSITSQLTKYLPIIHPPIQIKTTYLSTNQNHYTKSLY